MSVPGYDAAAFAELSQRLIAEPALEPTLQAVVDHAVATIDGCDYAGVTLLHGRKVETPAATDPVVFKLDQAQYDLVEGPCLDAVFVDDMYVIEDMETERRWPKWAPTAVQFGVKSVVSVRLSTPSRVVGGLNMYSRKQFAYDEDQVLTAHVYARHASTALAMSGQIEGLNTALQTRHQIGLAQGLLIQRYGLSEEQAFQFLARVSQDSNMKLRDVAARLIADAKENGRLP
jgi:ANTAR domain-containing protein/GAF domain-containing protein